LVYCEHRIKANDAKDIEPSAAVTQSFLAHGAFKQFVPRRVVPVQCYVAGALEANNATSDVVWELLQSTMHMDDQNWDENQLRTTTSPYIRTPVRCGR
jgi:hypothetical protein